MAISKTRSSTGTSNEVGDAERPKSIRKVTKPVSATAPPGRRPLVVIHRRRSAEQRDEGAPCQLTELHWLPQLAIAGAA